MHLAMQGHRTGYTAPAGQEGGGRLQIEMGRALLAGNRGRGAGVSDLTLTGGGGGLPWGKTFWVESESTEDREVTQRLE